MRQLAREKSCDWVKSLWTTAQSMPAATAELSPLEESSTTRVSRGVAQKRFRAVGVRLRVRLGEPVVLASEDEVHEASDVASFVDDVEVHTPGGRHDGHPGVRGQLGERLDDAVDLDPLGPQVLLVVPVAHLALPADRLFVDPCRSGLRVPRTRFVCGLLPISLLRNADESGVPTVSGW